MGVFALITQRSRVQILPPLPSFTDFLAWRGDLVPGVHGHPFCFIVVNGGLYMAEATPEGYKELGNASLFSPPEPWAPMSFKDGKLIARDMHKLVCLDLTVGK